MTSNSMFQKRTFIGPVGIPTHLNSFDRLTDGTNLVQLNENCIGRTAPDPFLDKSRIGHVEIVADDLHSIAASSGLQTKAVPIVFGKAILDRDDRIGVDKPVVESEQLVAPAASALAPFAEIGADGGGLGMDGVL